ncbi:AraC family transcriptional regulator [Marinomonas pollencensis]|uniref:AraC family transcriptional regulator n=1 Tax=Marinomonas pollencensis TaxID=491954 RepID=A0A3E0DM23_9GAMM|nr:AraC family transcriptional regulator [Marinomonas pollencensis]REG83162.1 AraC family transcriptional regulator [Marinomonas pollencensis]
MAISDSFRYQHIDTLPGLIIGEATFTQFSFQPHFHLDYHIGLVTQGVLHQSWKGQKHHLTAGNICLMPPDVVHSGVEQGEDKYHLITFRISPERLQTLFSNSQYTDVHRVLAPNVIDNPLLAKRFLQLKNAFQLEGDTLQQDILLLSSMEELLRASYKTPQPEDNNGLSKQQFLRIRDYCEANLQNKITLDELAKLSGLTRFQFIRYFQKQTGLAPHTWLMRLRLEKACSSLTSSDAMITDIAADNGFYDQSHFNRAFKAAYQVAPSIYRLRN